MLDHLAKKDQLWRDTAFNICKCKDLADELTNLMYLRIYNYNVEIEKLTENYVCWVIYNLFRDHCKQKHDVRLDYLFTTQDRSHLISGNQPDKIINEASLICEEHVEDDFDDEDLDILSKAKELKWWEQQLLVHSYDKSLRQIEKEFNINYQFVRRHTNKAKKFILGENYKKNGKKTA